MPTMVPGADAATGYSAAPAGAARSPGTTGPLVSGQPFGPRYQILRVLGAGGMGVVYQAWDGELGVAVALKVIRPEVLHDPDSAGEVERRFKRELVLARQVTHKNVVRIHDLGEVDGIKYLTMPFVEGENLAAVLKRQGKLALPQALLIARQVASGLAAAHEVGVVHRDLKPENIMLEADGDALIMDFGISRSVSGTGTATQLGAVLGTLEYMAPEQAQGQQVDQRADIYSFGLVIYDMIVGRQRLAGRENPMSEMLSRMAAGSPSVRTVDPNVPEPLDRILSRCLATSPDARYGTAAELLRDLEALTPDGHAIRPVVPLPGAPAGVPRKTVALAGGAILLLLGAGVGWVLMNRDSSAPAGPREPVSVLVANFENRANDEQFDGLLEQALAVGIEGTSFVTAFPRRDALRIARELDPGKTLNEEVARLVARREG
ncbi:MAG: serine/threonine protein kinase, partial [Acidobacteria bacterium]|nr:serine/threonine protein kinase [Acidobacteriota bacterium]